MTEDEKKEETTEIKLEEIKSFLIEVVPIVTPLIERAMEGTAAQVKNTYDLQKRQLISEGVFLFLVIVLGAVLIMAFMTNGKPDTAEKITFALLGFLGGRGFTAMRR